MLIVLKVTVKIVTLSESISNSTNGCDIDSEGLIKYGMFNQ